MNPRPDLLQSGPFQKQRKRSAGVVPNPPLKPTELSIGWRRHAAPEFIEQALAASMAGLASHPSIQDADASTAVPAGNGRCCADMWIYHA